MRAFSDAVFDAIRPLAHEQHTQAVAQALFDAKFSAVVKREPGASAKRRLDEVELESHVGTSDDSNRADATAHAHATLYAHADAE